MYPENIHVGKLVHITTGVVILTHFLDTRFAGTVWRSGHVYIADGYQLPERVADEIYITSPKGMVRQRAQQYDEIDADDILFVTMMFICRQIQSSFCLRH